MALISVCSGAGLEEMFKELGVDEIVSGGLEEGMQVVTGATQVAAAEAPETEANAGSPFLPKPPKRR